MVRAGSKWLRARGRTSADCSGGRERLGLILSSPWHKSCLSVLLLLLENRGCIARLPDGHVQASNVDLYRGAPFALHRWHGRGLFAATTCKNKGHLSHPSPRPEFKQGPSAMFLAATAVATQASRARQNLVRRAGFTCNKHQSAAASAYLEHGELLLERGNNLWLLKRQIVVFARVGGNVEKAVLGHAFCLVGGPRVRCRHAAVHDVLRAAACLARREKVAVLVCRVRLS